MSLYLSKAVHGYFICQTYTVCYSIIIFHCGWVLARDGHFKDSISNNNNNNNDNNNNLACRLCARERSKKNNNLLAIIKSSILFGGPSNAMMFRPPGNHRGYLEMMRNARMALR